jgi:hypothetical protein
MADKTITLGDGRVAIVQEVAIRAKIDGQEQIGSIKDPAVIAQILTIATDEIVAKAFYDPSVVEL